MTAGKGPATAPRGARWPRRGSRCPRPQRGGPRTSGVPLATCQGCRWALWRRSWHSSQPNPASSREETKNLPGQIPPPVWPGALFQQGSHSAHLARNEAPWCHPAEPPRCPVIVCAPRAESRNQTTASPAQSRHRAKTPPPKAVSSLPQHEAVPHQPPSCLAREPRAQPLAPCSVQTHPTRGFHPPRPMPGQQPRATTAEPPWPRSLWHHGGLNTGVLHRSLGGDGDRP